MSLSSNHNLTNLHSTFTPLFSPKLVLQIREFRVYRRRRLKLALRSQLGNQFGNLFNDVVFQLPSPNSLEFIAAAIGFVSGATLFFSGLNSNSAKRSSEAEASIIGEWASYTSPTPFNRFVLLRCPSLSFQGSELVEDNSNEKLEDNSNEKLEDNSNEKLVGEERHLVRLNNGEIRVKNEAENGVEMKLEYQRVCVSTDDGGVVSLDWPANLDLREEHGLDTTLFLVPGTAQGSMERNVRSFVCEALRRGCFPIVMNPRGCAGSPLTSARLFSAADSDDVSTAIQFINKARPWSTLVGVGWGYGANMLTKYLAEVGESTPLTAATCIDNPFDLEEATGSSSHHSVIDQQLTGGLVDILRSNKELFQGKAKRFDVEQALSAKSVCDFEKAISMVSYGFEAIEDFYSKSSTRGVVGKVKIPVLFIQKDDGSAPLFSIPRSLIAGNPFTSLLLCSCLPSSVIDGGRSVLSWCQNLTIEWLTAVELGLLKGRHPLLKDVDLPIDPPKGLDLVEDRLSNNNGNVSKPSYLSQSFSLNGYTTDPMNNLLEEIDTAASFRLRSSKDSWRKSEVEPTGLQDVGALAQTNSVDAELVNAEEAITGDGERGEVLQTAQVVMNILDKTMPDTLTEEKKKKVLIAVNQGDSLMKALQDAVPEDVRGKLTAAVSGVVPDMSKIQDKFRGISSSLGSHQDHHSSDLLKNSDVLLDRSISNQPDMNKSPGGLESESQLSEGSQNLDPQSLSSQGNEISGSFRKDTSESGNYDEESSKEKAIESLNNSEKGSETDTKPNNSSQAEIAVGAEEAISEEAIPEEAIPEEAIPEEQRDQDGRDSQLDTKEEEGNDNQKRDNKNMQPVMDQSNSNTSDSNAPAFSVSQALDALTGIDDNTQMAVNNVFGVIEDMISQLEESSEHENEVTKIDPVSGSESAKDHLSDDNRQEDSNNTDQSVQLDRVINTSVSNHNGNDMELQPDASNGRVEKATKSPISVSGNGMNSSHGSDIIDCVGQAENNEKDQLVGINLLANKLDILKHVNNTPPCITSVPYGVHKYLLSKVPTTSLDLDSTTALLLDYFPEEGQWKLLEQPGHVGISVGDVATHGDVDSKIQAHSPAKADDKVIEPSYVILDAEKHQEPIKEYETVDNMEERVEFGEEKTEEFMYFVKNIILNALKVEVGRRISTADMERMEPSLSRDVEQVANAVSFSVGHDTKYAPCLEVENHSIDCTSVKVSTLHGEHVIRAISSAVQDTSFLRRVVPVGVIVGSSLAGLRKYFVVSTVHENGQTEAPMLSQAKISGEKDLGMVNGTETHDHMTVNKSDQNTRLDSSVNRKVEQTELKNINNTVMVGAVTAALGASALLVEHQNSSQGNETFESLSDSSEMKANFQGGPDQLGVAICEKNQNNIVTSLAEKAMSVAAPVVPTKEDGKLDQERLVAVLTSLGQKGGMLRLVGKVALLWGGLRGAMSLTDKLIIFLHIAERPLIQRILGFVGMVLVLWSPVVVPLLPTFLQSWTTNTSSRIAELACIIGLYAAFMILVVIWGKSVRGYENPLEEYGLDLTSLPKLFDFLKGLIGGIMLVLSIQSINALLGCVNLTWPSTPSSLNAMALLKVYWQLLTLVGRGIMTATGVALVEEVLFRSWLPQEIAADLGYHRGIIVAGLAFSLSQRSPWAIPGLWLLSLSLSGARQINQGSLSIPIGLRAGIMASSFVLQRGGFLTYQAKSPQWVVGTHSFQPFSGLTGFAFSLCLALILYPGQPMGKILRSIHD